MTQKQLTSLPPYFIEYFDEKFKNIDEKFDKMRIIYEDMENRLIENDNRIERHFNNHVKANNKFVEEVDKAIKEHNSLMSNVVVFEKEHKQFWKYLHIMTVVIVVLIVTMYVIDTETREALILLPKLLLSVI